MLKDRVEEVGGFVPTSNSRAENDVYFLRIPNSLAKRQ